MTNDVYAEAGIGGLPSLHFEGETVRTAATADATRVAEALARAFYDDPVLSWAMPDEQRRADRLQRGFELFLRRVYLPHAHTYTTARVVGGALWLPPGQWRVGPLAQLRLLPSMAAIWRRDLGRVMRMLHLFETKHPHEPHYYLGIIGVEPEAQGRGIGTALMRPVLERCDAEGVPAYLEATAPRNRDCYLRNGFSVVEEVRLPKDGPPYWGMWREPLGR